MNPKLNTMLKKLDALLEARTGKLTAQHKLLICLGAWVVPVAIVTLLIFMPKIEEIGKLQERIGSLQVEVEKLRTVAAQLKQHQAEMAVTEERLKVASMLLPEQREIPALLTNISNLGTNSGLDFILFRPQNEVRKEFYAEIPVDISVRGPYHNVGIFLDRISKLPRIVTVNNLNMGSPSQLGNTMYLNTTFTLLTYRFIDPEPPAPAPATTGRRR